ncbi:polysaccharide deacetylase family protein [Paenibacillus donghaensis]|uniref:polysaccharide deacetylase family protein n=1 Tax=Paenibacillus donghaensis TaxID=414771 RepID=UPI001883B79F|nr:polysaccharide deacetylase family protein [Paenibacillus donghaensis]MBE9915453.1 polysaccharide deacetylase family protein [Paenibacillus donghaensis]
MKALWIVPLFALTVCSGCALYHTKQAPQAPLKNISQYSANTSTPDLLQGSEGKVRNPHPLSLADLRAKYKSIFLLSGSPSKREVALTFDDAPDDHFTPRILDVLKHEGVKATFFVVGNRLEAHPDIVRRMVKEGHIIGNHSYDHANLPKLSDADFQNQVVKTDHLIRMISGYKPTFIRPPYGNISEQQIKWLASKHKVIVNWNVDSLDWKGLNAEQVKTNIFAQAQPGSIILQHAAGGTGEDLSGTVQALPDIIHNFRNNGVKLVTVPELLDLPKGK